ncbi:MAG: hypothetical protein AMXMBFR64_06440 [Myxococcales bacterium]
MRVDRAELERRVEATERAYAHCTLCARRCGVDRRVRRGGVCDLGPDAFLYKEYVHYGEEEVLTPSHTIFLTGCNFRCVFCTDDAQVRDTTLGVRVDPPALAATIARRRSEGARNVNFVGGLPDVNLLAILRTLSLCPADTRVVWNTNLYDTDETLDLLDGVVDVWLADLKFGNDACARELSGARAYGDTLHAMLSRAAGSGEVLARHLVMPGHLECCTRPALEWLARHLPDATVNLMTAYWPYAEARRIPGLDRRTSRDEARRAIDLLRATGVARPLVNGRALAAVDSSGATVNAGAQTHHRRHPP